MFRYFKTLYWSTVGFCILQTKLGCCMASLQ